MVFRKIVFTFALSNRGVEQLVARWAHNPKVVGSSPTSATKSKESLKGGSFFLTNFHKMTHFLFIAFSEHVISILFNILIFFTKIDIFYTHILLFKTTVGAKLETVLLE